MKLKGRVAVVTGAGRGIGRAIALEFAKEGADVVVASRTLREINDTADQVSGLGRKTIPMVVDVSKRDEVEGMVKESVKAFGTVDILVANAGIVGPIGPLVDNDVASWIRAVEVNLIGTFLCTKAVLPVMIRKKFGKVIHLAGAGIRGFPNFSAYASSKAGIAHFTETVAGEVMPFGVDVNAILPGPVNTRMLDEMLSAGLKVGKEMRQKLVERKRAGGVSPSIAAKLATFLASSESNGLTGRVISAVNDDWKAMVPDIAEIVKTDMYTLRRLDPFTLNMDVPKLNKRVWFH